MNGQWWDEIADWLKQNPAPYEAAILRAMKMAREEDGRERVYPHELLIYIEDDYFCHFATMRKIMARMAKMGQIKRLGQRKGYAL